MKDSLTIKSLKFISSQNGEYKFIELRNFILENFENKPDYLDRYEILDFLRFLTNSGLIEMQSITNGLHFHSVNGKGIPREEISAKAKITSKGFDLLTENKKNIVNNISIYINIFFGFLSAAFAIWGLYLNKNQDALNSRVEVLNNEVSELKLDFCEIHSDTLYMQKRQQKK